MASTLIYQFLSGSSNTFRVPAGYSNQVAVYAWGAGGGNGSGAPGAGAGFVAGILTVNKDSDILVSVGGAGTNSSGYRPVGQGGIGNNPFLPFSGGDGGTATDEDGDSGSGGGGGGASAVLVNGIPAVVAAGGGGGAGYGDDRAGGATAGTPGGITTRTNSSSAGGIGRSGGGGAGGGGAGYPFGGDGGIAQGDDSIGSEGGYGGQNYANVAIVNDADIQSGSGTAPGGLILDGNPNVFYPKARRGYQGYDGAVILIFTKSFRGWEKRSGNWKQITAGWIKTPNSSTTIYRTIPPTTNTYNSGTHTFTIPTGVFSLNITASGGGGGGGGCDSQSGAVGRSSAVLSGTLSVSPGQVLTLHVGMGGGGGANDAGSAAGGSGGNNNLGYSGGNGSAAGPAPVSGGGGGGGAATALLVGGALYAVAGGGGGGGGGGNGSAGQGVSPGGTSGGIAGGSGQAKGGDGGGAGGGGGGHPRGGAGGVVAGGDNGGFSGADGQSLVPAGWTQSSAGNGGTNGVRGVRSSSRGGSGQVTISYSSAPVAEIVETGGWKQITRAWIKQDNSWKSIETPITLAPVVAPTSPASYQEVNLVIAADTNNYVLADFLTGAGYYPGRTRINLTVNANVTVSGSNAGDPAITIDNLIDGDIVNLVNNGFIIGRGGDGGSAGSYSSVTSGGSSPGKGGRPAPKGGYSVGSTTVTSIPGRPGGNGGTAIFVKHTLTITNNGTIAGGGGGGGGGGGPTGGRGGGGAGFGEGANNGTRLVAGAGAGLGGAGGALGAAGSAGTNSTNSGGPGGRAGFAIVGYENVNFATEGTVLGPLKNETTGLFIWSTASSV